MKKYILILSVSLSFIGCGDAETSQGEGEEEHGHGHEEGPTDKVFLTQEQYELMNIQTGILTEMDLKTSIKSNGTLELPPQNKASLSTLVGGKVRSVLVTQGDKVRKGQVLAYLENPEFIKMQQDYLTAKSDFEYYEKEYNRKKSLNDDQIISDKNLEKSFNELERSKAEKLGLKEQLKLLNISISKLEEGEIRSSIPILSPISGYVRLIEINIGKYVEPATEMFEIVDNEHLHLDLMVFERDISKITEGQEVTFSVTSRPNEVFKAKVFAVGKAFETDVKAVLVHAEMIEAETGLLPGMYVEARIISNNSTVMTVPNDAIIQENGIDYVFIQTNKNNEHGGEQKQGAEEGHGDKEESGHDHDDEKSSIKFQKIQVSIGISDMGFTEIFPVDAINDETKIVISGAYYLLAEINKAGLEHKH